MSKELSYLEWLGHYPSLLVSGIASGAQKRVEELERENAIMREALDKLAGWQEGFEIAGHFDEPRAAYIARRALFKCEEVEG